MSYSHRFVVVVVLFVTCLITANIMAVKLITVWGMTLPAAIVIFPISYILADVLTEVYGYRAMRRVIWLGFACNALTVAALALGAALPPAGFWQDQAAYEHILGQTPRILAASLAAYVVGEFANAYIMARLKVATEGRFLWLRTIGSTLVGEGLELRYFHHGGLRRHHPGGSVGRRRDHPMAGQIGLRSAGDPGHLRGGGLSEAPRGYRSVRPQSPPQPAIPC